MIDSAIYVGSVMHRRLRPRAHRFRYRAFWLLIDLDEADRLSNRLRWFSYNRRNFFSLFDADHGDGSATPIRQQIDTQLKQAGIDLRGGRIMLLCMPRTLGYSFNPLSVYFCYDADGKPAALVHQVHNTFGERHTYVLPASADDGAQRQQCRKRFYVSPFMDMEMTYDFRVSEPGERISVGICARGQNGPVLSAVLTGERRALTDANLRTAFLLTPAITAKVIVAIHWQALRLWLKRFKFHSRAKSRLPAPAAGPSLSTD